MREEALREVTMNPNFIPDEVLTAALELRGLPESEESYKLIATLSKRELFSSWLIYNGIVGYTAKILSILAQLDEGEKRSQE